VAELNVVVLCLDSVRRDYLSCYDGVAPQREGSLGQPVQTPHLDRLASESAVFDQAYINSFPCGPFRRDAWTGRYSWPERGWCPLETTDYTHAQALGEAGYVTMFITDNYPLVDSGYAIQRSYTEVPLPRSPGNYHRCFAGWDLVRGNQSDRHWPADIPVELPCAPEKLRGGPHRMELYLQQNWGRRWEREWFGPQVIQRGIDWMEENRRRPFFLWLDIFNTHEPFDPPRHYEDLYDPGYEGERLIFPPYTTADAFRPEEVAHLRAMYAGLITMMDVWIGRLLDALRVLALESNTLVIFTSDHGFLFGDHGLVGKSWPGSDGVLWQGIPDIPLIVRHPEGIGAGQRVDGLAQCVDLFPTVLEAAGLSPSGDIDGQSLLPVIRGEGRIKREHAMYARHGGPCHVTDGRYSLFLGNMGDDSGPPRLFDLENDPNEQVDIVAEQPEVAGALADTVLGELRGRDPAPEVLAHIQRMRELIA
jgi:arylsulfatase A-like enzyme